MKIEIIKDYEYCIGVGKKPKTTTIKKGETREVKKLVGEHLIRLEIAKKV